MKTETDTLDAIALEARWSRLYRQPWSVRSASAAPLILRRRP
jgi:hypothetical protein